MTESPKAADGTLPAQDVPQRLSSAVTSVPSDMDERLEPSRSSQRFLRCGLFDDAEGLVVVGASLASVLDMQALPLAFSWAESTSSTSTLHGALLWLLSISTAESSAAMPEQILADSMVVMVEDL